MNKYKEVEEEEDRRANRRAKRDEAILEGIVDCTFSLCQAIQEAGGGLDENQLDLSLREFIIRVAGQNGIRFDYEGSK